MNISNKNLLSGAVTGSLLAGGFIATLSILENPDIIKHNVMGLKPDDFITVTQSYVNQGLKGLSYAALFSSAAKTGVDSVNLSMNKIKYPSKYMKGYLSGACLGAGCVLGMQIFGSGFENFYASALSINLLALGGFVMASEMQKTR